MNMFVRDGKVQVCPKCNSNLDTRVLVHEKTFMIGYFCCAQFYQFSEEVYSTADEAWDHMREGTYEGRWSCDPLAQDITCRYADGTSRAQLHGHCVEVTRPAPTWTGKKTNTMMIPLTDDMLYLFNRDRAYEKCLTKWEKVFLMDGYTKADWDKYPDEH